MTPNQASKKSHEKIVYSNLKNDRLKQHPKFILGHLVRTADIKRVFSKGNSTNYIAIKMTIYLRDIMKTYYYQQNCLLMKIIKL